MTGTIRETPEGLAFDRPSHPDWHVTHHGRTTRQDFIGEGEPQVPEKCKSAPQEAEPVAWRWRAKGATTWIYDPDPSWLKEQSSDVIDAEPIYTHPAPAPAVPVEGIDALIADLRTPIVVEYEEKPTHVLRRANISRIEAAKALSALRAQQPARQVKALPIEAEGSSIEEMRANLRQHPRFNDLYQRGDVKLFWMNEGDACLALFSALSGEAQR